LYKVITGGAKSYVPLVTVCHCAKTTFHKCWLQASGCDTVWPSSLVQVLCPPPSQMRAALMLGMFLSDYMVSYPRRSQPSTSHMLC